MNKQDDLRVGTAVTVPLGDGEIKRFGWVTKLDGDEVTVDLGRDGTVTASRDQVAVL